MSTTPERPNFFILLDLDPDAPWNQADFEIRLKEKQQKWARDSNSPNKDVKSAASLNLKLVGTIRTVMSDDQQRREEAKDAHTQATAHKAIRLAQLDSDIEFYRAAPSISRKAFDDLLKDYSDIISESDLKSRLGIPIHEDAQQATSAEPEKLEPAKARLIRADLTLLGERSLYTLLKTEAAKGPNPPLHPLGPESLSSDLLDAARDLHRRMLEHMDKGPENTARKSLAGEAMVIFADEEQRKRYDTTLRLEPLDRLLTDIERLGKADGRITAQQAELFFRKALEKGIPTADAEAALTRLIKVKKWPEMILTETLAAVNLLHPCPNCRRLNDPKDQFCKWCKEPLWLDCPNCGAKHIDANVLACPACGFSLTLRPWVNWALNEVELLIKVGDWVAAASQLDEARQEWKPNNPDDLVKRMNELDATIAPMRIAIEEERKKQEKIDILLREAQAKAITDIEKAITERQFYRAKHLLNAMSVPPPNASDYRNTITREIDKAVELVEQARQAHGRGLIVVAARLYNLALDACADAREAQDGLKALPLAAPTHLRMLSKQEQSDGADTWRVELQWEPSPDAGEDTTYWVSKSLTPPTRDHAGEPKGTLKTTWTDFNPEPGATMYYSIYAEANGRRSDAISGQMLLATPVAELECEVAPSEVRLRWKATSSHLRHVRIRRGENAAPGNMTEGIEIAAQSLTSATDTNVRTGALYGYSVFAQYVDADGNPSWSPPATIRAVPQVAPHFICDLHAEQGDDTISYAVANLQCSMPATGELNIVRYEDPQHVPAPKTVRRWDSLLRNGRQVAGHTSPLKDTRSRPGKCWYVSIVRMEEMGYVGCPVPFDCVRNVDALTPKLLSDRAQLRWTWPRGCTRAVVAFSPTGWPSSTHNIPSTSISRDGAADGSPGIFEAPHAGSSEAFFIVTAFAKTGDVELASASKRIRAHVGPKPQLSMRQVKGLLSRGLELTMRHSTIAPALVVVSRDDRAPTSASDGVVRYQQESRAWEKGISMVPGSDRIPRDHFAGVFLTDESERAVIEVLTPPFLMQ